MKQRTLTAATIATWFAWAFVAAPIAVAQSAGAESASATETRSEPEERLDDPYVPVPPGAR